jgi:hypothetical protein
MGNIITGMFYFYGISVTSFPIAILNNHFTASCNRIFLKCFTWNIWVYHTSSSTLIWLRWMYHISMSTLISLIWVYHTSRSTLICPIWVYHTNMSTLICLIWVYHTSMSTLICLIRVYHTSMSTLPNTIELPRLTRRTIGPPTLICLSVSYQH